MNTPTSTHMSIADVGRSLRRRSQTCVDIVQACLDLIDRTQLVFNAFAYVDAPSALATADRLDRELRDGQDRGPLHGVPVAVKDIIAVANIPMRAGSSVYRRHPQRDAQIVRDLRAAGAIVVGMTRMHEIALGPTGLNPHDGGARNPSALGHIPGGSSSGSAVAVAAHLTPLAVGTDTGGSVRIPAALCGVVGLKPTRGLLPTLGVMPLAPTLDHVGLLARSVGDLSISLQAIGALKPGRDHSLQGARIGVLLRAGRDLEPAAQIGYERSLKILSNAGADLVDVDLDGSDSIIEISSTIMFYEAYRVHGAKFRTHPNAFGFDVRQRLADGQAVKRTAYRAALRMVDGLRSEAESAFRDLSCIVSPTVPTEALSIKMAGEPAKRALLPRNTRLFNLLGSPAISIPSPVQGLPIGFQMAAAQRTDTTLLDLAQAVERVFARA